MSYKAKQPPERIYLQWYGEGSPQDAGKIDENDVCWSADRAFKHDIVYVRLSRRPRKTAQPAAACCVRCGERIRGAKPFTERISGLCGLCFDDEFNCRRPAFFPFQAY